MPRRWCLPRVKSPNSALPVAVLVPLGQLQPIGGQRNSYTSVRIIKHLQTTPSPARPPSVASRRVDARRDAFTADSTGACANAHGCHTRQQGMAGHAWSPGSRCMPRNRFFDPAGRRADGHGHGPAPVSCARALPPIGSVPLPPTGHGDAAQIWQVPRRRCVCSALCRGVAGVWNRAPARFGRACISMTLARADADADATARGFWVGLSVTA
jgi:hypothetical protein